MGLGSVAQSPSFLPRFRPTSRLSPEARVLVGPSSHGRGGEARNVGSSPMTSAAWNGGGRGYGTRYVAPAGQESTTEIRSDFTLV